MYVCPERAAQAGKAALAAATALSTSWGPLAATQHSSCPLLGSQLVKAPGEVSTKELKLVPGSEGTIPARL